MPVDTLSYYKPNSSRYAEVELIGKIVKHDEDSKIACSKIKVVREITYFELWQAQRAWLDDQIKTSEMGDDTHSSTTGHRAHSSTTGYAAHSSTTGKDSISVSIGV